MKLFYYGDIDLRYLDLADRVSADSREVSPWVVLDFDSTGVLVGIDIDRASVLLDLTGLDSGSVPVEWVEVISPISCESAPRQ
jgi:uncharacterized protein YuzE